MIVSGEAVAQEVATHEQNNALNDEVYADGAFHAETDWQHCRKRSGFLWGPDSMAEHCAVVWADIVANRDPDWNTEHARLSFLLGYEDRATELAGAGVAGYEAMAEAGTLADTQGWVLQCEQWEENASDGEKARRAAHAALAGAMRWRALAQASGERSAVWRADEARIRVEAMLVIGGC